MEKRIVCILDPRDVIKLKTEKKISAIDAVEEKLKENLPGVRIEVEEKAFNKIVFVVYGAETVTDEFIDNCKEKIASSLELKSFGMTATEVKDEEPDAKEPSVNVKAEPHATVQDEEEQEEEASIEEKIDQLVGNGELKAFKEEIEKASAFYKDKNVLKRALVEMSYLVAMNPGNGRTTVATLMGEIIAKALGYEDISLSEYDVDDTVDSSGKAAAIDFIIRDISSVSKNRETLQVCLMNLDPMKNKFNSAAWFRLTDAMWKVNDNTLFIFAVVYLEDSILNDIHRRLDDVLCNRIIKFTPFTNEMYITLFKNFFKECDMEVKEDAYDELLRKITEEKADGCFYGINTVRKICNEILYKKALNGEDCHFVEKKDVQALLYSDYANHSNPYEALDSLISLDSVKAKVREIVASLKMSRATGVNTPPSMHMMFSGAPGTGKTAVARLIGQIFKEENILSRGDFYEVGRKDLVGHYVGHTAPKTAEVCRCAYGSVLFIDEAYSLAGGSENDFGKEAISTLIAEMENNRDNFIVVFAGYAKELEELFVLNPGLRDRIPYHIHFDNYSRQELASIFFTKIPKEYSYGDDFREEAVNYFTALPDSIINDPNFSNGRFARNLAERVFSKAALRVEMDSAADKLQLVKNDFVLAVSDAEFSVLNKETKKKKVGFY